MPRRSYKKNKVENDLMLESYEVAKLVNYVMVDGKKTVAEKVVYEALDQIKEKNLDPLEVLNRAIDNVAPTKEVKPRRVGGASYLVPMDTRPQRKLYLALNWIVNGANARSNKQYKSFANKLFAEIMDAYQNQGEAVNKRLQVEKVAQANKAFSHFNW
ncbi:MAG: 30S ribosomal protein S7 [Microgenomates bacterium OLB23]|nr:MAG: 30S ribosomal protein S7 [Microgenomates bacterium OLB23]